MFDDKPLLEKIMSERLTSIIMIILIFVGLAVKFFQSLCLKLDSDKALGGIMAMEFWKHHNYLWSEFYMPSMDPYYFTEIIPFYLVPQLISGFDPTILRLTAFVVFVLVLIVFTCLVYRLSGQNRFAALLFAVLAANLGQQAYGWVLGVVTMHNGTLLATGILFLLILDFKKASMLRLLAISAILGLGVFSDNIIIVWFLLPFLAVYLLVYREKDRRTNAWVMIWTTLAFLVFTVKTLFMDYLVPPPMGGQGLNNIATNVLKLFGELYRYALPVPAGDDVIVSLAGLAFVIVLLAAILIALRRVAYTRDRGMRMTAAVFITSSAIIFAGVIFTNLSEGVARYLGFVVIAALALIAICIDTRSRVYMALVAVLIVAGAAGCIITAASLDFQPNADEHALIAEMKAHNITYAYASYDNANVITYLSGEQVIVRPIEPIDNSSFQPYEWVSSVAWFDHHPLEIYVLVNNGPEREDTLKPFAATNAMEPVLHSGKYTLYRYEGNTSAIYETWHFDKGSGWERLSRKFL